MPDDRGYTILRNAKYSENVEELKTIGLLEKGESKDLQREDQSCVQKMNFMKFFQLHLLLKERRRGFHLITTEIIQALPQIKEIRNGICHVFIRHTSASLTINENADPDVRKDFESWVNKTVPENADYVHDSEGSDDMPAHLKASLMGNSVTIPVVNGKLALGIWQGIYLGEHRNSGGQREVIISLWGE